MIGSSADFVFVAALFIMIAASAYFTPRINAPRIPMQWGFDRRPTWFAPRLIGIWGPVVFLVLVRALIVAAVAYFPEHVHNAELGVVVFSVVSVGAHLFLLTAARRWTSDKDRGRF
jgi:hypothetical protein